MDDIVRIDGKPYAIADLSATAQQCVQQLTDVARAVREAQDKMQRLPLELDRLTVAHEHYYERLRQEVQPKEPVFFIPEQHSKERA